MTGTENDKENVSQEDESKTEQIKTWYKEGKIKRLGNGCYSVPSEAFVLGITPLMVSRVLIKPRTPRPRLSTIKGVKVRQMEGHAGGGVVNQFEITTKHGTYFQSYQTVIAFRGCGHVFLDKDSWNYSTTTGKYRNLFLGEDRKATERKIKSGEYILAKLND